MDHPQRSESDTWLADGTRAAQEGRTSPAIPPQIPGGAPGLDAGCDPLKPIDQSDIRDVTELPPGVRPAPIVLSEAVIVGKILAALETTPLPPSDAP